MKPLDPAWLDAQYNNRARVPGYARFLERWAQASALARERLSRRLDLRYGDGPNETLDLFPSPRANAPVLVFIHGGYWRALDKSDQSFVAPAFVAAGAMVVLPNYELCPSGTVESISLQMARAVAWVWRHAALYGGDPQRIVVAGHSAGGHLAAMMAACDWKRVGADLPERLLAGSLALSGLFELEPIRCTPFPAGRPSAHPGDGGSHQPRPLQGSGRRAARLGGCGDESEEFHRQTTSSGSMGSTHRAGVRGGTGHQPLHRAPRTGDTRQRGAPECARSAGVAVSGRKDYYHAYQMIANVLF
jgi:arylformamidase